MESSAIGNVVTESIPGLKSETSPKEVAQAPVHPEAPKEVSPDPVLEQRIRQISKRQQQVKLERQRLQREQDQIAAQYEEVRAHNEAKKNARLNPIDAIKTLGLDYDYITNHVLNNNAPTAEHKIETLESKLEEYRKQSEERELARLESAKKMAEHEAVQTIEHFKSQINDFLETKGDEFELIKFNEAQELVYETVEEYFNRNQKVLSIAEASKLVEDYLETRMDDAMKTKKYLSRTQAKQELKKEEGFQEKKAPISQGSTTLNNSMQAAASPWMSAKNEKDRIQRALAALDKAQ